MVHFLPILFHLTKIYWAHTTVLDPGRNGLGTGLCLKVPLYEYLFFVVFFSCKIKKVSTVFCNQWSRGELWEKEVRTELGAPKARVQSWEFISVCLCTYECMCLRVCMCMYGYMCISVHKSVCVCVCWEVGRYHNFYLETRERVAVFVHSTRLATPKSQKYMSKQKKSPCPKFLTPIC